MRRNIGEYLHIKEGQTYTFILYNFKPSHTLNSLFPFILKSCCVLDYYSNCLLRSFDVIDSINARPGIKPYHWLSDL